MAYTQEAIQPKVLLKQNKKRFESNRTSAAQHCKQVLTHVSVMSSVNKFITNNKNPPKHEARFDPTHHT